MITKNQQSVNPEASVTAPPTLVQKTLGLVSTLALISMLFWLSYSHDVYSTIGNDIMSFLSGMVPKTQLLTLWDMPYIAGFVVLSLFGAIISMKIIKFFVEINTKNHAVANLLDSMEKGHNFMNMFFVVCIEELFARGIFFGILYPLYPSTFMFYVLFVIGNILFGLVHIFNFKDDFDEDIAEKSFLVKFRAIKFDKKLLKVLPQFIGGIINTIVFMKFGLIVTIFVHMAHNCVLFASSKKENFTGIDVGIIAYSLIGAVISFFIGHNLIMDAHSALCDKDFSQLRLVNYSVFELAGMMYFISSVSSLFFDCFFFDRGLLEKNMRTRSKKAAFFLALVVVTFAFACYTYLGYQIIVWLNNLCINTTDWLGASKISMMVFWTIPLLHHYQIIMLLAIPFVLATKQASGSGISRTFFGNIIELVIYITIFNAVGFTTTLMVLSLKLLFSIPDLYLRLNDN